MKKISYPKNTIKNSVSNIIKFLNCEANNKNSHKESIDRILKLFDEICIGLQKDKIPKIKFFYEKVKSPSSAIEPIIVDNISIYSICEHHLLPFIGKATFKYKPKIIKKNGVFFMEILGLSKIPRIIDYLARKPQTQERLTVEIFDKFKEILETENISISMTCEHLCAKMRGIKDDITMTTSKIGGIFTKR